MDVLLVGSTDPTLTDQFEFYLSGGTITFRNIRTGVLDSGTGITGIVVNLNAGDDYVRFRKIDGTLPVLVPVTVNGGTGHDTIYGGNNNDSLSGGDGNDRFKGYSGKDTLNGGNNNDTADYGFYIAGFLDDVRFLRGFRGFDRLEQFVRFLDQVRRDRAERLLQVPRTPVGGAQAIDDRDQRAQSVDARIACGLGDDQRSGSAHLFFDAFGFA